MVRTKFAPGISVVVPTCYRAALLRRTLEILAAQPLERDAFEVVVSDDGSADHSAAVVELFRHRLDITAGPDAGAGRGHRDRPAGAGGRGLPR